MEPAIDQDDILNAINRELTGGGCPVAGQSLGECAAIGYQGKAQNGKDMYEAYIYLWDDSFDDFEQIANWFFSKGADEVVISWTMYDSINGDRKGRCEDGARPVTVSYTTKN